MTSYFALPIVLFPFLLLSTKGEVDSAEGNKKSTELNSVELSATVKKTAIAGTPVNLFIVMQNNGNLGFRYHARGAYKDFDLKVVAANDTPIRLTGFGSVVTEKTRPLEVQTGLSPTLMPGKNTKYALNLSRMFDLTQPGDYYLTVSRNITVAEKSFTLTITKIPFKIIDEQE